MYMKKLLLLVLLLSLSSLAFGGVITTIDFEQYSAFTQITTQYAGVDFGSNALQLVVPFYNYFDFPPHSGSGVITNDPNDPITINFSTPVSNVSFWYASPGGIVETDSNGHVIVGAPVDGSNLEITVPGVVTSISVSANLGADSETLDDLSYQVVPEPGSLALLGSGVLGLAAVLRRRISF
jgi:hypothetical protein